MVKTTAAHFSLRQQKITLANRPSPGQPITTSPGSVQPLLVRPLHAFIKQAGNRSHSILRLSIKKPCYNSYPLAWAFAASGDSVAALQTSAYFPESVDASGAGSAAKARGDAKKSSVISDLRMIFLRCLNDQKYTRQSFLIQTIYFFQTIKLRRECNKKTYKTKP